MIQIMDIENYLKKTDLGTLDKYTKIKKDHLDWKEGQYRRDGCMWMW